MAFTFPSSPTEGTPFSHAGYDYRYRTNPNRWEPQGFSGYNPFAAFAGPFAPASANIPASDGVTWVSPGNGSSRFWGFAPDSAGEPVVYPALGDTIGGWWSVVGGYNAASQLYANGYCGLTLPRITSSPLAGKTDIDTDAGFALSHNVTDSSAEVTQVDWYINGGEDHWAQNREDSSTQFNATRYSNSDTRPAGADTNIWTLYSGSTAAVDVYNPTLRPDLFNGTPPDQAQSITSSSMFGVADRVQFTFGSTASLTSDISADIHNTTWEFIRGPNVIAEWYSPNSTGTSSDTLSTTANHFRVRLYELYYRKVS